MDSGPIISCQIEWKMVETVPDIILIFIYLFIWCVSKSLQMMIEAIKLKMLTPWKECYHQPRQHIKKQKH